VGTSGIFVNLGGLYLLVNFLNLPPIISGALAIEASIINNFFWNNLWTWKDRRSESVLRRLFKYNLVTALTSALENYIVFTFLYKIGIYYILADLIGIGVAALINFLLSDRWVFK
jgi:dolichol-phosphate mannosyltransferase